MMTDDYSVNGAMKIIAIIPARGGSKSIPRKNIKLLADKPLIAHTIEQAKQSTVINRIVVSTEDQEIAQISRNYGAEVPFIRPVEFAQDDTPDWPVFFHALDWLKRSEDYSPDLIVNLRATTPNREVVQIDKAIRYFISLPLDIDGLRSIRPAEYSPYKMCFIREDGCLESVLAFNGISDTWSAPRQILPHVYQGDGYIDIVRPRVILEQKAMRGPKTVGYIATNIAIDIDSEADFARAQSVLLKRGVR